MKRILLTLAATVVLMLTPIQQPVLLAQLGLIQVILTCSDGVEITDTVLSVDAASLTALQSAVEAMTLSPAGLTCRLTQQLLGSLDRGLFGATAAFAQSGGNPNKDYAVGGGRAAIVADCLTNFGISAHVDADTTTTGIGGNVEFTIPQCTIGGTSYNGSHLGAKVNCLLVTGNTASMTADVTHRTGFFADEAQFPFGLERIAVRVIDSNMPGGNGDFIGAAFGFSVETPCTTVAAEQPVDQGNINVHEATP